jgi:hypothetical protein
MKVGLLRYGVAEMSSAPTGIDEPSNARPRAYDMTAP